MALPQRELQHGPNYTFSLRLVKIDKIIMPKTTEESQNDMKRVNESAILDYKPSVKFKNR